LQVLVEFFPGSAELQLGMERSGSQLGYWIFRVGYWIFNLPGSVPPHPQILQNSIKIEEEPIFYIFVDVFC